MNGYVNVERRRGSGKGGKGKWEEQDGKGDIRDVNKEMREVDEEMNFARIEGEKLMPGLYG